MLFNLTHDTVNASRLSFLSFSISTMLSNQLLHTLVYARKNNGFPFDLGFKIEGYIPAGYPLELQVRTDIGAFFMLWAGAGVRRCLD